MPMNNKRLGTAFEREVCELLSHNGYWVHFISPDSRGAQPFDIVAVKGGKAKAIDCKTCVNKRFTLARLEDNQIYAFEKWLKCGNDMPLIFIKHQEKIYVVKYSDLKEKKSVQLTEHYMWRNE